MSEAAPALPEIPEAASEAISKMSPETAMAARAQMAAAGYAVSAQGQVTKPAVIVPVAAPAAPAPNAERLATWRSLQARWSGDPAVVVREAAKVGIDLTHTPEMDAAASAVSAQQQQAAALAKAIAPAESYDKLIHANSRELSPEALGQQDSFFKSVFTKLGVPSANSQALLDSLIAAQALYPAIEEGADQADIEKRIMVEKDTRLLQGSVIRGFTDKNIERDAEIAIAAIKAADPKAHDLLYGSGAFMAAGSFHQLALIGRVLSARKAKP